MSTVSGRIVRRVTNQVAKMQRKARVLRAIANGVELGMEPLLGPALDFRLGHRDGRDGHIVIGNRVRLEAGAVFHAFGGSIELGHDVFIGPHAVIYGHGGVSIGDETLVAMHCCIMSSEHSVPDETNVVRRLPDIFLPTTIGRGVWLGAGAKILGGVTIGEGSVVGAGAVVTRDLPPFSIAVGVPARVVGSRIHGEHSAGHRTICAADE
jgi:acetyltransferase-like isoleucine patch superfamily enzyme